MYMENYCSITKALLGFIFLYMFGFKYSLLFKNKQELINVKTCHASLISDVSDLARFCESCTFLPYAKFKGNVFQILTQQKSCIQQPMTNVSSFIILINTLAFAMYMQNYCSITKALFGVSFLFL